MPSFKDIAVPSRNQPKKRDNEQAIEAHRLYVPVTNTGVGVRAPVSGHRHRFAVGQRLSMAPGGRELARGASLCSVVFLLPYEGEALRYRVRSDSEGFERIVNEADLMPLGNDQMPQFFFHVRRGASLYADPAGQELEDIHAAYTWAVEDARSLIEDQALEGDLRLYSIEICDADGRVLSVLPITS